MKYNLIVRPEAEVDIQEAFDWYESRQQDLGRKFIEALDNLLHRIEENPLIF